MTPLVSHDSSSRVSHHSSFFTHWLPLSTKGSTGDIHFSNTLLSSLLCVCVCWAGLMPGRLGIRALEEALEEGAWVQDDLGLDERDCDSLVYVSACGAVGSCSFLTTFGTFLL